MLLDRITCRRYTFIQIDHLISKPKNDLCSYNTLELEPTFIVLINKKSIVVIGATNRHPKMDLNELMTFTLILY